MMNTFTLVLVTGVAAAASVLTGVSSSALFSTTGAGVLFVTAGAAGVAAGAAGAGASLFSGTLASDEGPVSSFS